MRTQLSVNELNNIIEKIVELNSNVDSDIIIKYKGNKKFVNSNEINRIFENYSIKIKLPFYLLHILYCIQLEMINI